LKVHEDYGHSLFAECIRSGERHRRHAAATATEFQGAGVNSAAMDLDPRICREPLQVAAIRTATQADLLFACVKNVMKDCARGRIVDGDFENTFKILFARGTAVQRLRMNRVDLPRQPPPRRR
jgi:hypothetical protein